MALLAFFNHDNCAARTAISAITEGSHIMNAQPNDFGTGGPRVIQLAVKFNF